MAYGTKLSGGVAGGCHGFAAGGCAVRRVHTVSVSGDSECGGGRRSWAAAGSEKGSGYLYVLAGPVAAGCWRGCGSFAVRVLFGDVYDDAGGFALQLGGAVQERDCLCGERPGCLGGGGSRSGGREGVAARAEDPGGEISSGWRGSCGGERERWFAVVGLGPLPPIKLRKVFKVDTLSPDFGVRRSKKSYKVGLEAAKYS